MDDDTPTLADLLRCADGLASRLSDYASAHWEDQAVRAAFAHALELREQLDGLAAAEDLSMDEPGRCACAERRQGDDPVSDATNDLERRRFLLVLGASGASVAAVTAPGCGGEPATPVQTFAVGRVSEHPQGLWKIYPEWKLIVGRDSGGFFAFSMVCPHQGYDVAFQREDGSCMAAPGCRGASTTGLTVCTSGHGSTFDANGAVTRGPADRGLKHFQVTVRAGEVVVNTAVEASASARAAV